MLPGSARFVAPPGWRNSARPLNRIANCWGGSCVGLAKLAERRGLVPRLHHPDKLISGELLRLDPHIDFIEEPLLSFVLTREGPEISLMRGMGRDYYIPS